MKGSGLECEEEDRVATASSRLADLDRIVVWVECCLNGMGKNLEWVTL